MICHDNRLTPGGQGGDHRRPGWGPQEARVGTTGGQGEDHRRPGWGLRKYDMSG